MFIVIFKQCKFCLQLPSYFLFCLIIIKSHLFNLFADQVDVWSDFIGGGGAASDYINGGSPAVSTTDLKVTDHFGNGASFSEACAMMKGATNYSLTGEACSTEAKFICIKSCKLFHYNVKEALNQ